VPEEGAIDAGGFIVVGLALAMFILTRGARKLIREGEAFVFLANVQDHLPQGQDKRNSGTRAGCPP
jgi:hypothetical protein